MDIQKELNLLEEWLSQKTLDPLVRLELEELKASYDSGNAEAEEQINDRFYRFMEFGTAGMRGIIGAGPNRINIHTVRKISQGYADYLNEITVDNGKPARVAIAYDNRRFSDLFALEAAFVFVANGIETHLFSRLSATPLLSYAARVLGTDGGVVVTASHNNKYYNGYKIYDSHGCQCMPDDAARVAELIDKVDMWTGVKTLSYEFLPAEGDATSHEGATEGVFGRMKRAAEILDPLLMIIPEEMELSYISRVLKEGFTPGALENLSVVYTPLNGTGSVPVQFILNMAGVGELSVVKEQEYPDPDFTTAPEPNPEKAGALRLGLELCEKMKAEGRPPDIFIGTDPDADRLGAAIYHGGEYVQMTGNQVGVLILDYIINCREAMGKMPERPVFITTIVSTPITGKMAEKHGIETRLVLTGFKNIGDQMNKLEALNETGRYIFGFEESCGYCSGVYCRDKDAQNAALLLLEAAGVLKRKGKTLLDRMEELYAEYGYYLDGLDELVRPGEKGMHEIGQIMAKLRREEAQRAFSSEVVEYKDYLLGVGTVPVSDVLQFDLADGGRILARPSGTEPKLKIYYTGVGRTEEEAEKAISRMKQEIAEYIG